MNHSRTIQNISSPSLAIRNHHQRLLQTLLFLPHHMNILAFLEIHKLSSELPSKLASWRETKTHRLELLNSIPVNLRFPLVNNLFLCQSLNNAGLDCHLTNSRIHNNSVWRGSLLFALINRFYHWNYRKHDQMYTKWFTDVNLPAQQQITWWTTKLTLFRLSHRNIYFFILNKKYTKIWITGWCC